MTDTVMISVRRGDDQLADLLEASGNIDAAMTVRGVKPVVYLWRLSQDVYGGYDTYDSCVVAAVDEAAAKRVHPGGGDGVVFDEDRQIWIYESLRLLPGTEGYAFDEEEGERADDEVYGHDWACHAEQVLAVCIGATTVYEPGAIVCSSFNAG
jgi:hypothetical protein